MKRFFVFLLILPLMAVPVRAETIKWVDFGVPYESLKYALNVDIATFEQEKHISWIDILALSGCRTGGKCDLQSVKKAALKPFCSHFPTLKTSFVPLMAKIWAQPFITKF